MRFLIVCILLSFSLYVNAQSYFQYKFAMADSKMNISNKMKEDVLKVFQKKLTDYKYKNAKCLYDSSTKLFVVQSETNIELEFLTNVLIRYSKNGFEMFEVYSQKELLDYFQTKDLAKVCAKKNLLFLNSSIPNVIDGNSFYVQVLFADTLKFSAEVLKFKNYLPKDILFISPINKIQTQKNSQNYVEFYGIKNNSNCIKLSGLVDSANVVFDSRNHPAINLILNENEKKLFSNLTKNNIGKCIAIVINKTFLLAPYVTSQIEGGSLEISGNFTYKEVSEFVSIMKEENLPIKLKFVKSEIVKK